jgi:hypothetical protein
MSAGLVARRDGALLTDSNTTPVLCDLYNGHPGIERPGLLCSATPPTLCPRNDEGANLAMLDGAEIGQAIAAHFLVEWVLHVPMAGS